jgi:hypothetical protein
MIKQDVQFGDIIATRSESFISKAIRFFMKIYKDVDYSHNAVIIDIWGEVWVAEALTWGVRIYPFESSPYSRPKTEWIILRHKQGFTPEQIKAMSWKCVSLGGVRYQYENLPSWVAKILFKLNWFKSNNEKSIYCSELAAIAINAAYPGTFKRPNEVSPADHVKSSIYNIIFEDNGKP